MIVLIVAKCIVNMVHAGDVGKFAEVLIVAKCIVNDCLEVSSEYEWKVLIVAKCIVNCEGPFQIALL